ncbi:MAG: aldose 1-epimerase family protein [Treponema sp.]|nr:aldose 1-epimerase family protein [Treponema sp.]
MNYTIENNSFKAVINSFGAEIQSLVRKSDSTEYIWSGDSSVWKNHAPILFPFVARCLGGYFMIEGKKCEYSRNHGFARDLDTKVILQEDSKIIFELTESEDTLYRFPYHFSLQTCYEVTENGLNWTITVKNTDSKAFRFGVGTHTAFACPRNTDAKGTKLTDYEVEFQNKEPLTAVICTPEGYIEVDENGNAPCTKPYGETKTGIVPLTEAGFANGHLFGKYTSEWVGLRNKKDNSIIKISTKGFPYCMLWQNTSGAPQFVCIEPWHGIPDVINTDHIWENKLGMNEVKPGESFVSSQNITVE